MDVKNQPSESSNRVMITDNILIEDILKNKNKQIEALTTENMQYQKDIIKLQKLNHQISNLSPVWLSYLIYRVKLTPTHQVTFL